MNLLKTYQSIRDCIGTTSTIEMDSIVRRLMQCMYGGLEHSSRGTIFS